MTHDPNSYLNLIELLRTKAPGLLKILASRTDEEFDEGLEESIEKAVDHLERNAGHFANLDEEGITASLVGCLSIIPGLQVTQEAHSNGHVDITIETEHLPPLRRRLGEAKIYKGPTYHAEGLQQLVERYATGREGSGFIFEYVKKPNIKDLVVKVRSHLDNDKPCGQEGDCQDHRIRWAFTTQHQHTSGELLRVLHMSINLYRPST
jgi:hypothetical protein